MDDKGNDLVFKGLDNKLKQDVDAPYVICPEHTKEAWEEYILNNPIVPDVPDVPTDPDAPVDPENPVEPGLDVVG